MEMFKRILSMMCEMKTLKVFFAFASVLLLGCTKSGEDIAKHCGINGMIDVGTSYLSQPNGFKVTIEDVYDNSVKHISISDADGKFVFRDIEAGTYSINAEKDGYRWVWMVDDGVVNHRDRIIELNDNKTKDLKILMDGKVDALDITDLNGNPINRIGIPRNASTISIRLFNGTQISHSWELDYDKCFVSTSFELEYVFSSFNVREGILAPGDNIVLVGTINPNIFSPQFQFIQGVVYLSDYGNVQNMFNSYELYFIE